MALLLVHLRRLILLLSVVYLSGAAIRRLLTERHHAYVLQPSRSRWTKDPLHFQWWAYIYTCYAYVLLVNYVSMRRLTNLIEFFLT
ncbi:uncharacterized protein LOC116806083 [Drosophila grimshawi]|uniref:uncharacterized protein LOC116806083 n=1 Tax=Drosophila grimshawi TaxID=7222 RepID=UPI000C86EDD1|nr:uncharacterized protein LOC116806083 [Drosophila grimshawi]